MPCARGPARAAQDSECVAEKRCEARIGEGKTKEKDADCGAWKACIFGSLGEC